MFSQGMTSQVQLSLLATGHTPAEQAGKGHPILQLEMGTPSLLLKCRSLPSITCCRQMRISTQRCLCVSFPPCSRSPRVSNCSVKITWRDITTDFSSASYPISTLWLIKIHKISCVCMRSLGMA